MPKDPREILLDVHLEVAASADGKRTFKMSPLYSGGAIRMKNCPVPFFLDIDGGDLTVPVDALLEHLEKMLVGTITRAWVGENDDGTPNICAEGEFEDTPAAQHVITEKKLFEKVWQCSIHTYPEDKSRREIIPEGVTFTVNGKEFIGPAVIIRFWKLLEGSFVNRGADAYNAVTIKASAENKTERNFMPPELKAFLESIGQNVDEMTPELVALAEAMFAKLATKGESNEVKDVAGTGKAENENAPGGGAGGAAGGNAGGGAGGGVPGNPAAPEEDPDKKGVAASGGGYRPQPAHHLRTASNVYNAGNRPSKNAGYEIGLMDHMGLSPDEIKASGGYNDNEMTEGLSVQYRNMTLQSFAMDVNRSFGCSDLLPKRNPAFVTDFLENIRTSPSVRVAASGGFATIPALEILNNVANKMMRYYYERFTSVADKLSEVVNTNDLKPFYSYDYDVTGGLLKLAKDGRIESTTVTEEKTENQVETRARRLMITDEDIINDDLDAFGKLLKKFSRKAAIQLEQEWFALFNRTNAVKFTTARGNRVPGDSRLTYENVGVASQLFREIEAIGSTPEFPEFIEADLKYLLVPPALEMAARQVLTGAGIAYGGDAILGDKNLLSEKLQVISSPYLSAKVKHGSNTRWGLFPDPVDCPVQQIAYYNGQKTPVCSASRSQPEYLAQIFTVVHRWGIGEGTWRCGMVSDGTSA